MSALTRSMSVALAAVGSDVLLPALSDRSPLSRLDPALVALTDHQLRTKMEVSKNSRGTRSHDIIHTKMTHSQGRFPIVINIDNLITLF